MRTQEQKRDLKLGLLALTAMVILLAIIWLRGEPRPPDNKPPEPASIREAEQPETGNEPEQPHIIVQSGSPVAIYLEQARYFEMQMGAVTVEMDFYLWWAYDDKEEVLKAAEVGRSERKRTDHV